MDRITLKETIEEKEARMKDTRKTRMKAAREIEKINKEMAIEILKSLTGKKKEQLIKTLDRNFYLTSCYMADQGTIKIYKEGFYLSLEATRASFSVFAYDNDGELIIADRKPHDSKLNFLYETYLRFDESDFYTIR